MSNKVEKRINLDTEIRELSVEDGSKSMKISGYAAVFNTEINIGKYFREKILPNAFTSSIQSNDIRALWNHDDNFVLGRNKNGSLKLNEDSKGLFFELVLPDTTIGRDTYENIKQGLVSGVSFGFTIRSEEWIDQDQPMPLRVLKDVNLVEISPTAFPAYEATEVYARSILDMNIPDLSYLKDLQAKRDFLSVLERSNKALI